MRDVLVNKMQLVFAKELYASASFVGIVILFFLLVIGVNVNVAAVPSILVVIFVRLVAMRFNWNLPRAGTRMHERAFVRTRSTAKIRNYSY